MPDFKDNKPARNADHHVTLMKSRGLNVNAADEILLRQSLNDIGYYRLSGYFSPLQNPKDIFKTGTTVHDILRLYEFDKELRIITSYAVKSIEIKLKTYITDLMSLTHESNWYMEPTLFYKKTKKEFVIIPYIDGDEIKYQQEEKDYDLYEALTGKIQDSISKNSEKAYIRKFKIDYGNSAIVPSWMMMECISFGTLSKLYNLMILNETTRKIAKNFGCPVPETFGSWIHGFVVLRNHCAHHSRLWNIRPTRGIEFPKKKSFKFHTTTGSDINLFYGIGCCLLKALKATDVTLHDKYKFEVLKLIDKHSISKRAMGFPENLDEWDVWK